MKEIDIKWKEVECLPSGPITSMIEFQGAVYIASGSCMYRMFPEQDKFYQVLFMKAEEVNE